MESNGSEIVSKYNQKFPFEIVSLDDATKERVLLHFKGPLAVLFHVGPEKWVMPKVFPEWADTFYNFESRPDDVWLSTFSRSGTTWTSEMIWLLCNELNYEAAKATKLCDRFPFLEMDDLLTDLPDFLPEDLKSKIPTSGLKLLPGMASVRTIKTHLPIKMMPHEALAKGCKVVYVARNPKDVLVSLFHFVKFAGFSYTGNFEEFVDYFMDDLVVFGPHFEHLKDGWNRRNESNVLFMFYEDLVMDLSNSHKKLALFLGRPLSDSELPDLMEHLDFKNFKENSSVNMKALENVGTGKWKFVRRGQVGGNPEMTPEVADRIDAWTEAQLKDTGMTFPHQMRHRTEMYRSKAD